MNYPTYLTFVKLLDVLDVNILDFVQSAPLTNNPLQDEIMHLTKNADNIELKNIHRCLKNLLKRNLKNF